MALTVNIYYSGTNGNARKFAEEMVSSGTVDSIRAEEGNIRYEYFFPMNDGETVLLIDSWKDQHSIDVHHASPMMKKIIELREKYDLHMKAERYVSDENGVPEADKAFIRE
ncbi:MAG: antibiotic biosynthesis monooxygenase [Ruminococcus sp.]|nr:antibiotic biosynthesis monooxygenase [Ruminococcus sp.]